MNYKILLILIFVKTYSQEKTDWNNLYWENKIAFKKQDNTIFTGIVQNKSKNGHVKYEEIYNNGKLIKSLLYYNINFAQLVSTETIFNPETNKKIKLLNFSSDGKNKWETNFDENEEKSEFNFYKNGKIIEHKEFFQGKKNGKWFCFEKDGSKCEIEYENGKKIKDCRLQRPRHRRYKVKIHVLLFSRNLYF